MPKVYTEEKREEIKTLLLKFALLSIQTEGYKKMRIESLTKKAGIAQGTFYSFFESKEDLVYCLAINYQKRIKQEVDLLIITQNVLDRQDLKNLYQKMFLSDDDNVYRYLKREDLQLLLSRLPKNKLQNLTSAQQTLRDNLVHIKNAKPIVDIDAVINWIQLMNLALENKDLLIDTGIEKLICRLIDNMLDEIFQSA